MIKTRIKFYQWLESCTWVSLQTPQVREADMGGEGKINYADFVARMDTKI